MRFDPRGGPTGAETTGSGFASTLRQEPLLTATTAFLVILVVVIAGAPTAAANTPFGPDDVVFVRRLRDTGATDPAGVAGTQQTTDRTGIGCVEVQCVRISVLYVNGV